MSDLTAIEWAIGLVSVFVFITAVSAISKYNRATNYDVTLLLGSFLGSVWFIFKLLGFE